MIKLPEQYVIAKFNEYAGFVNATKGGTEYVGCCNMCREGKSWGKEKRLHYYTTSNKMHCYNCGYNESDIQYIMDSSFMSFAEVMRDSESYDTIKLKKAEPKKVISKEVELKEEYTSPLPENAIDLLDINQLRFYKNNKVVKDAFNYLKNRGILKAINRPKTFYISLTDYLHKNRIVIPSYGLTGKIEHYQTRQLYPEEGLDVRYISKLHSNKTVFNIDKVSYDDMCIYIFEGAFNACFVKNGVAISGISLNKDDYLSTKQKAQLSAFTFHRKILVLDNQWVDKTSLEKSIAMVEKGEDVFIWPEKFKKYKDINDLAIAAKLNEIRGSFFNLNVFPKEEALRILKSIKI